MLKGIKSIILYEMDMVEEIFCLFKKGYIVDIFIFFILVVNRINKRK